MPQRPLIASSTAGMAIAAVINIVDPHVVVLGGGRSNVDALYTRGVEEVEQFVQNHRKDARIAP